MLGIWTDQTLILYGRECLINLRVPARWMLDMIGVCGCNTPLCLYPFVIRPFALTLDTTLSSLMRGFGMYDQFDTNIHTVSDIVKRPSKALDGLSLLSPMSSTESPQSWTPRYVLSFRKARCDQ